MNSFVLIVFVVTFVGGSIGLPVHHTLHPHPLPHPHPVTHRPIPRPDHHRFALIQKAAALEQEASKVIQFLNSQHKQAQAAAIKKDEDLVKRLATELQHNPNAHSTHLTQVESQLAQVEVRLEQEIKNSHYVPPHTGTDVHKRQLLDRAALLEKQAMQLIQQLKANKRDPEAVAIEHDVELLKSLAHTLQSTVKPVQVRVIETQLSNAENRLAAEIQKASQPNPEHEHQMHKQQLLQRATVLQAQVEEAIKYLRDNKRDEAIIFETEQSVLKQLVVQLGLSTSGAFIEQQLEALEIRLAKELDKFHADIEAKDPVRIQLLTRATALEKQAAEAIAKLKTQNKTIEAGILEKDEIVIKELAKQLQSARGAALIVLEKQLGEAEARLALEIGGVH